MTTPENHFLTEREVVVTRDEDSGFPVLVIDRPHGIDQPKPERLRFKLTPDGAVLVARQLAAAASCSHGDGVALEVSLSVETIDRLVAALRPSKRARTKPDPVIAQLCAEGKL